MYAKFQCFSKTYAAVIWQCHSFPTHLNTLEFEESEALLWALLLWPLSADHSGNSHEAIFLDFVRISVWKNKQPWICSGLRPGLLFSHKHDLQERTLTLDIILIAYVFCFYCQVPHAPEVFGKSMSRASGFYCSPMNGYFSSVCCLKLGNTARGPLMHRLTRAEVQEPLLKRGLN